jgi:hypothetical protein
MQAKARNVLGYTKDANTCGHGLTIFTHMLVGNNTHTASREPPSQVDTMLYARSSRSDNRNLPNQTRLERNSGMTSPIITISFVF